MRKTLEMILGSSAGDVTCERDGTTVVESVNRCTSFSLFRRDWVGAPLIEMEPVTSYQTILRISSVVTTVTREGTSETDEEHPR